MTGEVGRHPSGRATRASHRTNLRCSGHSAGIPDAAQIANDADFLVEADIPIPPPQKARVAIYGAPKYPWDAMEVGDSFLVPGDGSAQQQIRVNTASNVRAKKRPGEAYVTRVVGGGVRVWRIELVPDQGAAP